MSRKNRTTEVVETSELGEATEAPETQEEIVTTPEVVEAPAPGSYGTGFVIQKNVEFKGKILKQGEKIKASELGSKIEDWKKREIIK